MVYLVCQCDVLLGHKGMNLLNKLCPPLMKRGQIALHMSVCLSPFRFQTTTLELLGLPSSDLFHRSILGSRGTLLVLGSKVKVIGVKCAKTSSNQLFENTLTYLTQAWSRSPLSNVPKPFRMNNE